MSTLKKNITAHRLALLAAKGEIIFHHQDLANLWNIQNANTLRVTLARYVKEGLFYRIHRGFYSLRPLLELDPVLVGARALHQFCYLSTETVLYQHGFLSQKPHVHTFVSAKSAKFNVMDFAYISRQLKVEFLYHPEGIVWKDGVYRATPERALADMLYFNTHTHFDKSVDWEKIKNTQYRIHYPLTLKRYVDFA